MNNFDPFTERDLASIDPLDAAPPVHASIELIDAEKALEILSTQKANRTLSKASVTAYYNDIVAGRWTFNGEGIKLDIHGNLIDGQHRLHAIARTEGTGIAVQMLVVRGLPPESQLTMDQGRKRNAAQQLGLLNVADASAVAAGARIYLIWTRDLMFRTTVDQLITASEIAEWVETSPEEVELIQTSRRAPYTAIASKPSSTSAAFVRLHLINYDAAEEFFEGLSTGANLAVDSPILALKNRFDRAKMARERLTNRDELGMYTTAWNAWRKGKPLQKVAIPRDGWTPEKLSPVD